MNKLTKKQAQQQEDFVCRLRLAEIEVESAVEDFNAQMMELFEQTVQARINAFNEVLAEANLFRENISEAMREHYDEKSERWQESDAGCDHDAWTSQWEDAEMEEIEAEAPELFELTEMDSPISEFENLPISRSG